MPMRKILVLLVLASSMTASAEEYATLSGVVCDESGLPIQYATIQVGDTDIRAISDEDGFYQAPVPPGEYDVTCHAPGYVDHTIEGLLLVAGIRSTVKFILSRPPEDSVLIIRKPNIYLYPTETIDVSVRLEFAEGCALTYSDPPYGDGWRVTVSPDGWMDNGIGYVVGEVDGEEVIFDAPRYGCLFYEADAPDVWQTERGWLVDDGEDLGDFFSENLAAYGFEGREIKDFLDYWVPRLTAGYYAVFPQLAADIEPLVGLNVYPEPDSVLRLFYYLVADPLMGGELAPPVIEPFERTGFTVVEWGVCLDDGLK
jgi:hypothetical protein